MGDRQILGWLQKIGPRNSACIRHLVIRYNSLLSLKGGRECWTARNAAWAAAFQCMPNLLSVVFDFRQKEGLSAHDEVVEKASSLDSDAYLLRVLANSASAWSQVLRHSIDKSAPAQFCYRPTPTQLQDPARAVNHSVIAIDEDIPRPLIRYFGMQLMLPNMDSLELPITGLPKEFFHDQGLNLGASYAFNDKSDKPSIILAYHKRPSPILYNDAVGLKFVLDGLPVRYLRIGCRHINSSALSGIPNLSSELETLDVAFTDSEPEKVADYLDTVSKRCKKLFTLAIDVSPLHDRDPDDHRHESFFNRNSVSKEVAEKWKPFWDKLDEISAGGVRVWEGEGPGFRRRRVRLI